MGSAELTEQELPVVDLGIASEVLYIPDTETGSVVSPLMSDEVSQVQGTCTPIVWSKLRLKLKLTKLGDRIQARCGVNTQVSEERRKTDV